jgi:hypothetical protein
LHHGVLEIDDMAPLGFDPIGSLLAWIFILLALGAGVIGLTVGGISLLVARRYRHA